MMNFNPSSKQILDRNIDRIKTLRLAILDTYDQDRLTSLNNELTRRTNELSETKRLIDEALR
tara:strand:+ start:1611 stop:1796 length:186 start_codon:yes stop_codon:yes gene_type:complete